MSSGRILALDIGNRRIGLALSDEQNFLAQPLLTLYRGTLRADLESLARLIRRYDVGTLVVGDPLHADGTPSPQALKARAFAEALFAQHPELAHHTLDERLTARDAHELLDAHGARAGARDRLHRKDLIDQVAATLLLEAHLSRLNGPALLPDPETGFQGIEGVPDATPEAPARDDPACEDA